LTLKFGFEIQKGEDGDIVTRCCSHE